MRSTSRKILIAITAASMLTACAFGVATGFEAPANDIYAATLADAVTPEEAARQLGEYRTDLLARGEEEYGTKWEEVKGIFEETLELSRYTSGVATAGDLEKAKLDMERAYAIRRLDIYIAALLEDESISANGGDVFLAESIAELEKASRELEALEYAPAEGQDAEAYLEELKGKLGGIVQDAEETVTELRTAAANRWYSDYCTAAKAALKGGEYVAFFTAASNGIVAYEKLTDYDKALIEDAIKNSAQPGQLDEEEEDGSPVKDCEVLLDSMKNTWSTLYTQATEGLSGSGATSRETAATLLSCFDALAAQLRETAVGEEVTFQVQADALVGAYKKNIQAAIEALGEDCEDAYVKESIQQFCTRVGEFYPEGSYGNAAVRLDSLLDEAEAEISCLKAIDEADRKLEERLNELLALATQEGVSDHIEDGQSKSDHDVLEEALTALDTEYTEEMVAVTPAQLAQDPEALQKLLQEGIAAMEQETADAIIAAYKKAAKSRLETEAEKLTLVSEEERSAVLEATEGKIDGVSSELSGTPEEFLAAQKKTIEGFVDEALKTLGLSNALKTLAETYKGQLDSALAEYAEPSQAMQDIVTKAKGDVDEECAAVKPADKTDDEFLAEVEGKLQAIVDGATSDMALLKLKEDAVAAANAALAGYPEPTEEMEALTQDALEAIGKVQAENAQQDGETDEAYQERLKSIYDGIVAGLEDELAAEAALAGQLAELENAARAELDALKVKYSDLTEDETQDIFDRADEDIEATLASRREGESAAELLERVEEELGEIVQNADSALQGKSNAKKQLMDELRGMIEEAKQQADEIAEGYAPLTSEMEEAVEDAKDALDAVLDDPQGERTDEEYRTYVGERIEEVLDGLEEKLAARKEEADFAKELDDLLAAAKQELEALYRARLDHNHYGYSESGKSALKAVYDGGVTALDELFAQTVRGAEEGKETFRERLQTALLAEVAARGTKFETVAVSGVSAGGLRPDGTGIKDEGGNAGPTDYPADSKELWGMVLSSIGMDGRTRLTLTRISSALDELAGRKVEWAFAASLAGAGTANYTVKLLLPAELRSLTEVLVAYRNANGDVETFSTRLEGGKFLVFETTHFSDFYLLGEKLPTPVVPDDPTPGDPTPGTPEEPATEDATNLTWLIVVLAVVLGVEAVAIVLLILRRRKNRAASIAVPALLLAVTPAGAIPTIIVLGVLDVLGLAAILLLLFMKGRNGKASDDASAPAESPAAAESAGKPAATSESSAKKDKSSAPAVRHEAAVSYDGGPDKKRKKKNDTHRKNNVRRKKLKSKKH